MVTVSVCMITYDHSRFIRQAVESILNQQGNFELNLIIADDCSPDDTAEIISDIVANNPNGSKIQYFRQAKNIGPMPNFVFALEQCRGKYLAICEGDDFWYDDRKLQKQISLLENNLDYAGCAHQTLVIYEDIDKEPHVFHNSAPRIITLEDVLVGRKFHTCSLMLRGYIIKTNTLPKNVIAGDRLINLLVTSYGDIYYSDEVMACYRKSSVGISSRITYQALEEDKVIVDWMVNINPSFPKYRYLSFIHYTIFAYPKHLPLGILVKNCILYIFYSFSEFPKNLIPVTKFLVLELPKILIRNIRYALSK